MAKLKLYSKSELVVLDVVWRGRQVSMYWPKHALTDADRQYLQPNHPLNAELLAAKGRDQLAPA